MSERTAGAVEVTQGLTGWNADLEAARCRSCGACYLFTRGSLPHCCPKCCHKPLDLLETGVAEAPNAYPAELVIPFSLSEQGLEAAIQRFKQGIPFTPLELEAAALHKKRVAVYLPMWLIDASASAYWQADAGYAYKVVSHQEFYDTNNQWSTRETKEKKLRWEMRLGRLTRQYHNTPVPALDDAVRLEKQTGGFDITQAQPYQAEHIRHACVRLPDHTPKERWNDAAAVFQKTAAEECRKACSADQLRQFRWKAKFTQLNWTLLLLPVYTVSYLDDHGQRQSIWINGQSGKVAGARRASMRSAIRTSLVMLGFGILLLALGLGMGALSDQRPALETLSLFTIFGGIIALVGCLLPFGLAWDFNRKQEAAGAGDGNPFM